VGEIADALKKANAEQAAQSPAPAPVVREQALPPLRQSEPAEPAPPPVDESPAPPAPSPAPGPPTVSVDESRLPHLETHRQLALRIRAELDQRQITSFAVVSALRNEGKTMVACTVAMALASISPDRSVALLDLDLRNPSVGRRLELPVRTGIEAVLRGRATLDDVQISIEDPQLDVYPALEPQTGAHELLAGVAFVRTLDGLLARYATVIIDTPPTLMVPDASLILSKGPACLPVARLGRSRVRRFQQMLRVLPEGLILGKILNGAATKKHEKDYYYYGQDDDG
jgi:Mrp family chromosome partitioning ATPase